MIDVTKCLGCRKGIGMFLEENGEYNHCDLFATAEAGSIYLCKNSDEIKQFLVKTKNNTYLPNDELQGVFKRQEFWWEDIITLAYDIFDNGNSVKEFFNITENDVLMWNRSNNDIENALIKLAEEKGIEVTIDNYPDLFKFK